VRAVPLSTDQGISPGRPRSDCAPSSGEKCLERPAITGRRGDGLRLGGCQRAHTVAMVAPPGTPALQLEMGIEEFHDDVVYESAAQTPFTLTARPLGYR
jgi:hypothetical protein